jgi:glycosyltransferase involved in cell wall biosynthesis
MEEWFGRYFNCPESYAEPLAQYDLCKARGMTLVTLTDHDTIAGGLALIDRRDFFLSEEITTRFPENGCVMHVLAWDIDPDQHAVIQERRDDIYKLTDYLRDSGIAHGLAHPLLSPNWKLDRDTFEKALLLFPTFESINGLNDARIEPDLAEILSSVDEGVMQRLALKHGLPATGKRPHLKAETGGSDDHVSRRSGTVYTQVESEGLTPAVFLQRVMAAEGRAVGRSADLNAMSACTQKTTSDFLRRRDDDLQPLTGGDPVSDLMESVAGRRPTGIECGFLGSMVVAGIAKPQRNSMGNSIGNPTCVRPAPQAGGATDATSLPALDQQDSEMVQALGETFDRNSAKVFDAITAAAIGSLDVYRIIDAARDLVCSTAAVTPYLFAVDHFGRQYAQVRSVRRDWNASPLLPRRRRLAVFSDSLEQVDGVSTWCERFAAEAGESGCDVLVPYCGDIARHPEGQRFHALPAVRTYHLPFYSHMRFYVPSLIGTIDWMWRQQVSNVELSSPGPMGLVGLLAAKLLRLPVTASYHTEVPTLISALGADPTFEAVSKKYVAWFYNRADAAFVFSERARHLLQDMGVDARRIELLPITVNPDHFNPRLGSPSIFRELGIELDGRSVVLSVGRLSEEKNIPMIIEAVRRLQEEPPRPLLVIVGEGPERVSLEARFGGEPYVRFVGLQRGERLRRLYASARVFAFASRVDTLGLVNLEAMSSGVPVLLPSDAGVAHIASNGVSAEFYRFGTDGLTTAMRRLLGDPEYANLLATNARSAMIDRWSNHPFSRIWESFTRPS